MFRWFKGFWLDLRMALSRLAKGCEDEDIFHLEWMDDATFGTDRSGPAFGDHSEQSAKADCCQADCRGGCRHREASQVEAERAGDCGLSGHADQSEPGCDENTAHERGARSQEQPAGQTGDIVTMSSPLPIEVTSAFSDACPLLFEHPSIQGVCQLGKSYMAMARVFMKFFRVSINAFVCALEYGGMSRNHGGKMVHRPFIRNRKSYRS